MTTKQKAQFNQMRAALLQISRAYMTPTQLEKQCKSKQGYCGLNYEEALEMSYENIQGTAAIAVKGVKQIMD